TLSAQKSSYYYNTQEIVWGVTGLGKWVQGAGAKAAADGKLTADGVVIDARKVKQKTSDKTWGLSRASEYGKLTLDVPASAAGMWLVIASEGIRPGAAFANASDGLTVHRQYHGIDTVIDASDGSLKLGDIVFVEVEVTNTSGSTIQNLALVDRLPAGFEIENPRLGRSMTADWFQPDQLWNSDFLNMRDDRIEVFGSLGPNEQKKIVYTVRVTSSGKFTIPPVEEQLERALGGGNVDRVEDANEDDETSLTSKRFVFASFFNRLKRQVAQNWEPAGVWHRLDPQGTVYGFKTRITEVRVVLAPNGVLDKILVTQASGVGELDDEAVRAFKAAAPFPNPPDGLVKDGRITFAFSFYFEIGQPRSSWKVIRSM
ncbi:MAG TPA: TonB family protein, partial [Kofleriaceae bacterium]|nr:TonB family protein [Kofleriaceae bacterium]